jgi:tRNA pseudouridine-54 N-methylase
MLQTRSARTFREMVIHNPVIQLCIEGTQAEFAGRMEDACALYMQAWRAARDDYEACVAAHYVARCQENAHDILQWNQEALDRAKAVNDERVQDLFPSLYVNIGRALELLGDLTGSERYYELAADGGLIHEKDGVGRNPISKDNA